MFVLSWSSNKTHFEYLALKMLLSVDLNSVFQRDKDYSHKKRTAFLHDWEKANVVNIWNKIVEKGDTW